MSLSNIDSLHAREAFVKLKKGINEQRQKTERSEPSSLYFFSSISLVRFQSMQMVMEVWRGVARRWFPMLLPIGQILSLLFPQISAAVALRCLHNETSCLKERKIIVSFHTSSSTRHPLSLWKYEARKFKAKYLKELSIRKDRDLNPHHWYCSVERERPPGDVLLHVLWLSKSAC